jgi:hypothetical protein
MKQTINFYDFQKAFQDLRPNNFTYEGLRALFEYLEELEESTGDEIEFDIIALCCDFTEYESVEEYERDYNDDIEDNLATTSDSGSLIVYAH